MVMTLLFGSAPSSDFTFPVEGSTGKKITSVRLLGQKTFSD